MCCRLVYRPSKDHASDGSRFQRTAIYAVTESALVTWIGLALLEIASLAPTKGHITVCTRNFGAIKLC